MLEYFKYSLPTIAAVLLHIIKVVTMRYLRLDWLNAVKASWVRIFWAIVLFGSFVWFFFERIGNGGSLMFLRGTFYGVLEYIIVALIACLIWWVTGVAFDQTKKPEESKFQISSEGDISKENLDNITNPKSEPGIYMDSIYADDGKKGIVINTPSKVRLDLKNFHAKNNTDTGIEINISSPETPSKPST